MRATDSLRTLVLAALAASPALRADITLAETFDVRAMGALAQLSAQGTTTTIVADGRGRVDNLVLASTESMDDYAAVGSGSLLVLPAERRLLQLDPAAGTYRAHSYEQMRARLDYGRAAVEGAAAGADMVDLPVREEECRWTPADSFSRATGVEAEIAGVKAAQYQLSWAQTCEVAETGQQCELTWNLERWQADRLPGGEEWRELHDGLFRAMGGVDLLSAAQQNDGGLLDLFSHGWVRLGEEARSLPGFPVRTSMSLEIGGVNCTTGGGTPLAYDSDWAVMQEVAKDTARASAKRTATNTVADTVMRSVGLGGWGGWLAGVAASEMTRRAIEKAEQKREEELAEPVEDIHEVDPDADAVMLFRIDTELVETSRERVDAAVFQPPPGWAAAGE